MLMPMRRRLPPLGALRAFEAAARLGSFKQAADELAVTPTAISHQVRALEAELGISLFERQTRRVVPTMAALRLYPVLRDGFDAFSRAVDAIRQPGRAMVTISATTAFTARWLLPRVPAFQAAHPEVDLRLHASNAVVDLASGTADLAIRYGTGPYPGVRTTLLAKDRFVPVASPRLRITHPRDLAVHGLVHFEWHRPDAMHPTWARWLAVSGQADVVDAASGLHFTDESHAIQAVIAGQGVGLLSEVLLADDLARGLVELPFGPALDGMAYHLLEPQPETANAAVAAVKHSLLGCTLAAHSHAKSENE